MERRPGITMRKKERLDPVQYNDNGVAITLSWDDVEINSILRAEVRCSSISKYSVIVLVFPCESVLSFLHVVLIYFRLV